MKVNDMARQIWKGGVPLGFDGPGRWARPISYSKKQDRSGNAPTLVIGPPGSSKTVGLIATQLLDEPGKRSFIVLDTKAELAAVTANYRRRVCGKDSVKIINPYGLLTDKRPDLKSDQWNPCNALDPTSLGYGDECAAVGDAAVKPELNEHQPHFSDCARSAITGGAMYVVRDADAKGMARSLPSIRALFTQPTPELKQSIARMMKSGDFDITSRVAKFLAENDEINSIKSTIERHTSWMSKPLRDDMATEKGVDFRDCTKRPTTIYVCVPVTELAPKAVYLRLIFSAVLRALYVEDAVPTTVIVEEAFVLGYHREIEQALSILRGYDSRLTIVFQSLQQTRQLYPATWGLFTAGAVVSFRPAEQETREWLVRQAGTIDVPVRNSSDGRRGEGPAGGWGIQRVDRLSESDLNAMPPGRGLVFLPHAEAPRQSWIKGYYEIPRLAARADPNPLFKGGQKKPRRGLRTLAAAVAVAAVLGAGGLWAWGAPVGETGRHLLAWPPEVGGFGQQPSGTQQHVRHTHRRNAS
jgi:type IV secretory pathway TraG/TraD family ATPase VirD4